LSLGGLSQVHWVAKGFLVFSLIDALMAVYYATTQQRAMGRLLRPKQVRAWIRGGIGAKLPTLDRATRSFAKDMKLAGIDLSPCDPQDLNNNQYTSLVIPNYLRQKCFTPSVVSVITISAPQMLLSGSLITLLLGLGIYFGFTWTDKLDAQAGPHDSRNVFITFVVGLGVCTLVYSLSGLIHDKEDRPEVKILDYHMKEYIRPRKDTLENDWGMYISGLGDQDSLLFVRRVPIVSPV
jgi:hypothetical protein